jgi:hypothetical protein
VRAAFHPAAFESSLARHKEEAAAAAQVLAADIRDGRYDPARPDFNQGQLDPAAEAAGEARDCCLLWLTQNSVACCA